MPGGEHIGYMVDPLWNMPANVGTWSIDINGGNDHRISPTSDRPLWSPDGTEIAEIDGGNLFVRDIHGNQERWLVYSKDTNLEITGLSWSPDGKHLTFSDVRLDANNWDRLPRLHIIEVDSGNGTEFEGAPFDSYVDPQLSPDNRIIAFGRFQPSFSRSRINHRGLRENCQIDCRSRRISASPGRPMAR
jgi:WD40 repeat protein